MHYVMLEAAYTSFSSVWNKSISRMEWNVYAWNDAKSTRDTEETTDVTHAGQVWQAEINTASNA